MSAFSQIPSLVSFSPLTVALSGDVNSNFSSIRNQFNNLVTGSNAIAVDTISENTLGSGVTVNKKFAVSAGVATFASGIAIAGGVVSGIATFSSGWAVSGGTINVSGVNVSGIATFTSGFGISGGVVSGNVTFASGWSVSAGTINVSGISVSGLATFTSGFAISAGTPTIASGFSITGGAIVFTTGGSAGAVAVALANDATSGLFQDAAGLVKIAASGVNQLTLSNGLVATGGPTVQFRINGGGLVCASAALATSATLGYIYIPTFPSTGTGVPANQTGTVALAYDTGSNRIMVYNGAWRTVAVA